MKEVIHVITTIERGGAENQLLLLAASQVASGRKVTVVPLKGKTELKRAFLDLKVQVNVSLLNKPTVVQIWKLKRIMRKSDVICHAHLPRAELICAATFCSRNLIVTRHNTERFFPGAHSLISRILSNFVVIRAHRVIAISEAVRIFLQKSKEIFATTKVDVIRYGINCPQVIDKEVAKNIRNKYSKYAYPVIGTIGRLVDQKDYPTLIKGFQIFLSQYPHARLLIAGEGPKRNEIEHLIQQLKIDDNVVMIGKIAEVFEFYSVLDLFVLASKYEGLGLVLLEAMCAGIPIVASNISAIPEVLGLDHPGLTLSGDASDFALKMKLLIDNETQASIQDLQKLRLKNFSIEKMRASIEIIYRELDF